MCACFSFILIYSLCIFTFSLFFETKFGSYETTLVKTIDGCHHVPPSWNRIIKFTLHGKGHILILYLYFFETLNVVRVKNTHTHTHSIVQKYKVHALRSNELILYIESISNAEDKFTISKKKSIKRERENETRAGKIKFPPFKMCVRAFIKHNTLERFKVLHIAIIISLHANKKKVLLLFARKNIRVAVVFSSSELFTDRVHWLLFSHSFSRMVSIYFIFFLIEEYWWCSAKLNGLFFDLMRLNITEKWYTASINPSDQM